MLITALSHGDSEEKLMVGVITSAKWIGVSNPKNDVEILGVGLKSNAKEADVQFASLVMQTEDAFAVFESTGVKCRARSTMVTSASNEPKVQMRDDNGGWTLWVDIT